MNRLRRSLFYLTITGLLVAAIMTWVPYFHVSTLTISGTHFVAEEHVQSHIAPWSKRSIARTWLTIADELLNAFPQLDEVHISMPKWGHIHLTLHEKPPVMTFVTKGKSLLVAKDGTYLNTHAHAAAIPNVEDLFIVHGLPNAVFDGTHLQRELLSKVTYLMTQLRAYLPDMDFQLDMNMETRMDLAHLTDIELLKDDTLPIKVGAFERLEQKFKLLRYYLLHVLPQIEKQLKDIHYIDLRVSGEVIVKYGS